MFAKKQVEYSDHGHGIGGFALLLALVFSFYELGFEEFEELPRLRAECRTQYKPKQKYWGYIEASMMTAFSVYILSDAEDADAQEMQDLLGQVIAHFREIEPG